jgi:Fuc2NAc and GlcNAc transferase
LAATLLGVLLVAAALTAAVLRSALRRGNLDVPNARSSHTVPTPRGGGLAIVIATSAGLGALALLGVLPTGLCAVMIGGGGLVAAVGFVDDHRPLPVAPRLIAYVAAAALPLVYLGGLAPLQVGERVLTLGWAGFALGIVGVVWALNLFNFMDGIDGLAASEAAFASCAGAMIAAITGLSSGAVWAPPVFGAACMGFALWNWPPARIFMGNVGSGYCGYLIAVFALAAGRESASALFVWFILGGVFFVDATFTLLRRVLDRQPVLKAHRSHAYQRLARRWGGHKAVVAAAAALNLLWLLPCALVAALFPTWAAWIAAIAIAPVVATVLWAGAGRSERSA